MADEQDLDKKDSADHDDYDEYIVKVKRHDKDGNDITSDEPGSGGRRKEDGTISTQYYDPRPYTPDESKADPNTMPVEPTPCENAQNHSNTPRRSKANESLHEKARPKPKTRLVEEPHRKVPIRRYERRRSSQESLLETLIYDGMDFLSYKSQQALEVYVYPRIIRWRNEVLIPGIRNGWRKLWHGDEEKQHPPKEVTTVRQKPLDDPDELPSSPVVTPLKEAVHEYHNNMSDEEKQRHLLKIYFHYISLVREIQALDGVVITEEDLNAVKRALASPRMTATINSLLQNNMALLEDKEIKTLLNVFETEFVDDGKYIPIQTDQVRDLIGR